MSIPTRQTSFVLFLGLQEEIVKNSGTVSLDRLGRTQARSPGSPALHELPHALSAVPPWGAFLPEVLDALGRPEPRLRTQTSAFADAGLVETIGWSGRKVLMLAGVASKIVVQRKAMDALHAGYEVHVAVDAGGRVDQRTEDAHLRHARRQPGHKGGPS